MSIFPTKILLATDGSEEGELALLTTVDLANRTDSELHVVYVAEPGPEAMLNPAFALNRKLWEETLREVEREAREVLDGQVKKIEEAGGTVAQANLRITQAHLWTGGRPDRKIVELAEEIGAGLIAMGSRGLGGIKRALMGSVSDSVVRHAHCPVLVVRAEKGARHNLEGSVSAARRPRREGA
jgi:nucleotide-binding universal stress UspA family protein